MTNTVGNKPMKTLTEVLSDVDQLSEEEQAGLAAHLLANLRGAPLGPGDIELARREAEIDAGTAEFITFDELRKAVGR
jgi:Putative addiction module component